MSSSHEANQRSKVGWAVLLAALILEAIGGVALLIAIVPDMLAASEEPFGPRFSIFLAVAVAWVWVCITLGGALRLRASWVRGSAITIHVLLFAAGTGVLQLGLAAPMIGWGLVLLALVGFFAALIARPVIAELDLE